MGNNVLILTACSTESLTPPLAQRLGVSGASPALRVCVARAQCGSECWWQVLGPEDTLERLPDVAALAGIVLGQRLRDSLQALGALVLSNNKAAVMAMRESDQQVRWAEEKRLAAVRRTDIQVVTHLLGDRRALECGEYFSGSARTLADAVQHPDSSLWHLPAVIVAALLKRDDQAGNCVDQMLKQRRPGFSDALRADLRRGIHLREALWRHLHAHEEAISPLALVDPAEWRTFAPGMAEAERRLDALAEAIRNGLAVQDAAQHLVRALDRQALTLTGNAQRGQGWPLHALAPQLAPAVTRIFRAAAIPDAQEFLYGQKQRAVRAAWRGLNELLDAHDPATAGAFLFHRFQGTPELGLIERMLEITWRDKTPRFPLNSEVREVIVREYRKEARRYRKRDSRGIQQNHIGFSFPPLQELAGLTPGRRSIAILKDEMYWRYHWSELDPAWRADAEALKRRRQAQTTRRAAEKQAAVQQLPLPVSRYLTLKASGQKIELLCRFGHDLTLGSASLYEDAVQVVSARLSLARLRGESGRGLRLTARAGSMGCVVDRALLPKLAKVIPDIDQLLDAWRNKPLAPYHVEEVLNISKSERLRWAQAGRLRIKGHSNFVKGRQVIQYPLYDRAQVASITPAEIARWRKADAASTVAKRKAGARQAVATRANNARMRQDERGRIDDVARDAARTVGDMRVLWIVKLRFYGRLARCWANMLRHQGKREESAELEALSLRAKKVTGQVASGINLPPGGLDWLMGPFYGIGAGPLGDKEQVLYPRKAVEAAVVELLELFETTSDASHVAGRPTSVAP